MLLPDAERQALEAEAISKMAGSLAGTTISGAAEPAWGPLEYPPARKAALEAEFNKTAGASGRLELKEVHKLIFRGVTLNDERSLRSYDVQEGDMMIVQSKTSRSAAHLWASHAAKSRKRSMTLSHFPSALEMPDHDLVGTMTPSHGTITP